MLIFPTLQVSNPATIVIKITRLWFGELITTSHTGIGAVIDAADNMLNGGSHCCLLRLNPLSPLGLVMFLFIQLALKFVNRNLSKIEFF
jgi:hypothetical protein